MALVFALFRVPLLALLGLLGAVLPAGADELDAELQRIQQEVRQQALQPLIQPASVTPAQPAAPTSPPAVPARPALRDREQLPSGLSPADFAALLQREFAATFSFYDKLKPAQQQRVYELYQQDSRVSTIRDETLRLLLNR
ncbi:MAG TPA: hypothetical protein VNN09_10670 [Candidatus Competibacteraceae bacterium]|nr:hypothetical protein [Candidatus Competibacteraceae bacterium]